MAKQSLYAKSQGEAATTPESTLPVPVGGGFDAVKPPEKKATAPYVVFARKDTLAELRGEVPGLQDGDAVLIGDEKIKLSPVVFFLLDVFQFWCIKGGEAENYAPVKTTRAKPEGSDDGERWTETISAAALVEVGGRLIPATMRVQSGMCQGVYEAIRNVKAAASPEWATKSPEHAASMGVGQPNLRFKTYLSWRPKKSRGGFTYFLSSATIKPTTAGDAALLTKLAETPERVAEVMEWFTAYRDDMLALSIN